MSLVPTILDIDRDQNAPQASFGAVIMSSPTRTFRENLSQHVSNQKEMAITAGGSVCMTELPTEIQQHIYRSYFEALDVTVWVSPQPYTTPMGRGVKTTTTFPADNSYFALLLVCRKVYETARNLRSHIDLTIELREYTSSPYLEHLRRAIQEQPQLSRLFKECTRVVLWGGDGEFFQRLRLYLPRLQMLRLVNIEVDSPSISQITPHLGFDSLNELSAFLARSWKFGDNDKLQEYEGLIISRGSWAASACLEAFTGQDFAHTTSAVVSLEGLTTEIVVFRAEYYSVDGTEGEALLTSVTATISGQTHAIAKRADDWLRHMPADHLRAHISRKALTELTLKRRVTATEAWHAWTQPNRSQDCIEQAGLVDQNAKWLPCAEAPSGFKDIV